MTTETHDAIRASAAHMQRWLRRYLPAELTALAIAIVCAKLR